MEWQLGTSARKNKAMLIKEVSGIEIVQVINETARRQKSNRKGHALQQKENCQHMVSLLPDARTWHGKMKREYEEH